MSDNYWFWLFKLTRMMFTKSAASIIWRIITSEMMEVGASVLISIGIIVMGGWFNLLWILIFIMVTHYIYRVSKWEW